MQLMEVTDRADWDRFVAENAWGHPLQLWGWGEAKRTGDWTPHRLALKGDDGQWEAVAHEREAGEIAWYEAAVVAPIDATTTAMLQEILESVQHHADGLRGKWMPA